MMKYFMNIKIVFLKKLNDIGSARNIMKKKRIYNCKNGKN